MTAKSLQNTNPLDDLELFELIVAAYPEKFAEREAAGEDIWDEVMAFIEDDLCLDELQDWQGLARLLGRVVMLTMPMQGAISGGARHCLGPIEIRNGQAYMTAAVSRDVVVEANPEQAKAIRAGLEWAIARCKALQSQGLPRTRLDVLIKDFEGCLSVQNEKSKAFEPGLRWAIARCQGFISEGHTHAEHGALIQDFEGHLAQHLGGFVEAFACWSCKQPVTLEGRAEADGECPYCHAELDLETWPQKEA